MPSSRSVWTRSIRAAKPLLARLLHRQSVGALTAVPRFPPMASALAIACLRNSAQTIVRVSQGARSTSVIGQNSAIGLDLCAFDDDERPAADGLPARAS
jgi:hypothetical protein